MQTPEKVATAPERANLGAMSDLEVAAFLGISVKTLQNRRSKGTAPPACKVGRDCVTLVADLKAWIARRRGPRKAAA